MNEQVQRSIELQVDLNDKAYSDAVVQVIMARHVGISVRPYSAASDAGPSPGSGSDTHSFILRDAPGGTVIIGKGPGTGQKILAFFPSGERISRIVDRIYSLSGRAQVSEADERDAAVSDCVAFIAARGGAGTSTLARTFGRIAFREMGEKCLLLSLAPYGNSPSAGPSNPATRLYYRIMTDERADIMPLCSEERGVYTVEGRGLDPESGNLDPALLEKLLKAAGSCGFRYVLLDIGDHLEKDRIRLLKSCQRIVSVARQGTEHAAAALPPDTVYVETFCGDVSSDGTGNVIRIPDTGPMDEMGPAAEYCEKVRNLIRILRMDDGERKQDRSRGESGESGVAAHPVRRYRLRRESSEDHRGMRI